MSAKSEIRISKFESPRLLTADNIKGARILSAVCVFSATSACRRPIVVTYTISLGAQGGISRFEPKEIKRGQNSSRVEIGCIKLEGNLILNNFRISSRSLGIRISDLLILNFARRKKKIPLSRDKA